jgi:hemoglobin
MTTGVKECLMGSRVSGLVLVLLLGAATSFAQSPSSPTSLYQRLGGYDEVTSFVGLVFPRVVQHPALARMFGGHGTDSQRRQFQMVVELVCQRTGGPCGYTGRPMPTVHDGLNISAADWTAFMGIIDAGLAEKRYAADVRQQFRAIWEGFRPDVVQK